MKNIISKSSLIFAISLSAFSQVGSPVDFEDRSLLDLPVGTVVTLDGKHLRKIQSECPNKNKVKMLVNGREEVEIETADLLFRDGDVECSGGTDLALIYNDIAGRHISVKGKIQDKTPLKCTVKEVTEFEGSLAVYLDSPCSVAVFFKRSLLDFRSVKDLSIKSFQYNLGKYITFNLDHTHKAPLNVSSESGQKADTSPSLSSSTNSPSRAIFE